MRGDEHESTCDGLFRIYWLSFGGGVVRTEVYEIGLPCLLDLYARHDIKCTFYFTGTMCELAPSSIDLVKAYGHEIGCHSYSHAQNKALDVNEYTKMYKTN